MTAKPYDSSLYKKRFALCSMRHAFLIVLSWSFLGLTTISGCGMPRHLTATVDEMSARGEFSQALSYVEEHEEDYQKRNRLLFYLDEGMLAFSLGDFEKAVRAFTAAEQLMEELYTISISGEATTFLISDNTAPYRGEDFESVMVNLFLALSYANLSKIEDALVEARKIDSKLAAINLQYDEEQQNAYREDPFARMLIGIFYEMGQTSADLNDAYISYYLAINGYDSEYQRFGLSVPAILAENALSTAAFMGAREQDKLRQRFPSQPFPGLVDRKARAEVYGLHLNGRAPVKEAATIVFPMPDGFLLKLAFPTYKKVDKRIVGGRLYAKAPEEDTAIHSTFTVAEPIGKIAKENLADRKGRIVAKTIARVTAKYLAVKAAQRAAKEAGGRDYGALAGFLTGITGNILAFASEEPDLRSWRTLPAEILISKLALEPGTYQFWAECYDASGIVVRKVELGDRDLKAGDRVILQFRTTE
ncbi:MAG: hypothetical protein LJE89_04285 [Deltaproteobacteria bacterium]|nr:hypothetical protein [Deltaproteobacteria bacterium]